MEGNVHNFAGILLSLLSGRAHPKFLAVLCNSKNQTYILGIIAFKKTKLEHIFGNSVINNVMLYVV